MILKDLIKFSKIFCLLMIKFLVFEKKNFNQNDRIYSITYYFFQFNNRLLIILKKQFKHLKKIQIKKKIYSKKLILEQFFLFFIDCLIRCFNIRRFLKNINFRRFLITFKIQHKNEK